MNRRKIISLLLLVISAFFLLYSWLLIRNDIERSCSDRVNSYNYFLELRRDWILNSLDRTASALAIQFSVDDNFEQIISQYPSFSSRTSKIPWDTVRAKYSKIEDMLSSVGFSGIEIISAIEPSDSISSGFFLGEKTAMYRIVKPVNMPSLSAKCFVVFYFNQNQFYLDRDAKYLEHINLGYLLMSEDFRPVPTSYTKDAPFCKGKAFISADFVFPKRLFYRDSFLKAINDSLEHIEGDDRNVVFSLSERIHSNIYVFSVIEMPCSDRSGSAYLISITRDTLLDRFIAWKYIFLIINGFLMAFVVLALLSLHRDLEMMTKQKSLISQSEQKLKEINASKDKFFSIIAHDLRNPFNGIMGLSDYLCTSYDKVDDEEILDVLKEINLASRNSYNLLQNLLEWTRSQMGMLQNVPSKIDPKEVINLALETVWNIARNKQISISVKIETQDLAYADQNMVSTIIRNLVTNAIKYSSRGKCVELSVSRFKGDIVFRVKDEGVGLTSAEIDKLFRIDVDFHKRGTEQEIGSGLGLKLCDEFVRQCGGRIWVLSNIAEGSSFYFTIPLYVEQDIQS